MRREELYDNVFKAFEREMPVAESELHFKNPYELLVAVMLSAQCTDKRVNLVTPALFERYPDALALASAEVSEIYDYIRSVSYPNSKSAHLSGMAKRLVEAFGGEVPQTMEELTSLPGVGRKTANVVMAVAFHQARMAVDTHVFRVSARIGLTRQAKTPLETERQLVKYIAEDKLGQAHHWLLLHGRYVCTARRPHCAQCFLTPWCAYYKKKEA
ncbi:MAG: endonuclease III [Bacteroidales bacterium]|nr:endonuclease III [Bacteroidales bacterium]MDE6439651.1 endonuclease III [Bacteroidales bacterium]